MLAIVDASVLVAAADRSDSSHAAAAFALQTAEFDLVIPAICVAEATYLIERDLGSLAEGGFLASLSELEVIAPERQDWRRIAALVRQYANFPLGGTDASIVALAEKLNVETIMTLDQRHFRAIRPLHCAAFTIVPE